MQYKPSFGEIVQEESQKQSDLPIDLIMVFKFLLLAGLDKAFWIVRYSEIWIREP